MDGLEGAVAQAVSESVAITRSGSARFEHPVLGIGSLLLGFEFGTLSFRRLGGGAGLAASGEDRRGGDDHRDDVGVQLLGARGYSRDTVLEWICRYARCARLVDGASEVHKMVLARSLAKQGNDFWNWC